MQESFSIHTYRNQLLCWFILSIHKKFMVVNW
jgi:hypothetical protein